MPLYEYECQVCGVITDLQHKMAEKNKEPCPHCQAPPEKMKKLLSAVRGRVK